MPVDLALVVNGRRYSGWKSLKVTRSIESIAGSFALEVSDRWGGSGEPWPIVEEDECEVEIGGHTVITGFIDKRGPLTLAATQRGLTYSGRDRAAALVDCSALLKAWTYTNIAIDDFARALAAPFGIRVGVQTGLELPPLRKIVISPGDSPFEAIKQAAKQLEVLVVSDGQGGILFTRSAAAAATSLVEGFNVEAAEIEYDGSDRFHRYVVLCQVPGTDQASGAATSIRAEATDDGVKRTDRVKVIRPSKGMSAGDARRLADWEARTRAARAETVSIAVVGWAQPNGTLWAPNTLTLVKVPSIGIDGQMLISQVDYSISNTGGQVTQLRIVRPDAFTPEPHAKVSGLEPWLVSAGSGFKEPGVKR